MACFQGRPKRYLANSDLKPQQPGRLICMSLWMSALCLYTPYRTSACGTSYIASTGKVSEVSTGLVMGLKQTTLGGSEGCHQPVSVLVLH